MTDQITFADIDPEYEAFVEKFKPKKTTDDCYTPDNIYEAVAGWVAEEYGVDRGAMVRPFWPGKDFETEKYADGCCVVDNPPFSLRAKIVAFYMMHGIRFFLFSPSLTLLTGREDVCHIVTDTDITYANGAVVRTAFVTNLESCILRTAPELRRRIAEQDEINRKAGKVELPKYTYPDAVLTAPSPSAGRTTALISASSAATPSSSAPWTRSAQPARRSSAAGSCFRREQRRREQRRREQRRREQRPRYEVCGRCGQEWMVSKILPRRRPDELYICPRCARRGEGVFVRRK